MSFSIPESTIEEIRARTDLAELIGSRIPLKRAGASYKACCPFHHEKTPSFNVNPDKGFYHCFGCGESGDCFKFLEKMDGLTFIEAVKKLADACGVKIEEKEDPQAGLRRRLYELHAELAAFYRRCLVQAKEAAPARAYLAKRQLSDEVAERFLIGYAPKGPDVMLTWAKKYDFKPEELAAAGVLLPPRREGDRWFNRFAGRLMFAIRDRSGRVVAFSGRVLDKASSPAKYVNSPETPIFTKSRILYALDQAAPNIVKAPRREAIVCEGQIDVIRCHACGFPVAVASEGTAFTKEHVELLKKCADSVILVFDGDAAGHKADIRTGGEFLAAEVPVRVASLPEGDDPDSLLRDKGREAFQKCLDAAESITAFQVRTLRAAEKNPDSIDAVARVSKAALATIALCPSAVLRASLLEEAAKLLKLPVSALEEDLKKAEEDAARRTRYEKGPATSHEPPATSHQPPATSYEPPATSHEPPANLSAAAPENNPPPPRELALCEFLFEHEHDEILDKLLDGLLPPEVLAHDFTRRFVAAWREEITGSGDAIAALRNALGPVERGWLDRILVAKDRAAMSEKTPDEILRDFLRYLWSDRIRRLQGDLPADSSPENDRRRLALSELARKFVRAPWDVAAALMKPETLS